MQLDSMDTVLHERFGLEKHAWELSAHRPLITAPNMDEIAWEECTVRRGVAQDRA